MNFESEIKLLEHVRDNVLINHGSAVGEINQVIAKLKVAEVPGVPQGAPESAQGETKAEEKEIVVIDPDLQADMDRMEKSAKAKKKSK